VDKSADKSADKCVFVFLYKKMQNHIMGFHGSETPYRRLSPYVRDRACFLTDIFRSVHSDKRYCSLYRPGRSFSVSCIPTAVFFIFPFEIINPLFKIKRYGSGNACPVCSASCRISFLAACERSPREARHRPAEV